MTTPDADADAPAQQEVADARARSVGVELGMDLMWQRIVAAFNDYASYRAWHAFYGKGVRLSLGEFVEVISWLNDRDGRGAGGAALSAPTSHGSKTEVVPGTQSSSLPVGEPQPALPPALGRDFTQVADGAATGSVNSQATPTVP